MSKTVEDVVKGLKLKATPTHNVLSLRVGVKKFALPFEARTLVSDQYLFAHLPPTAAIFRITDNGLVPVEDAAEAIGAVKSLRPRKQRTERAVSVDMPDALAKALSAIPSGYKLAYDANGQPRLVKKRERRAGGKGRAKVAG